ncbi:MAG: hypothetical protein U0229_17120 [Anaeromyxobacter sp.]
MPVRLALAALLLLPSLARADEPARAVERSAVRVYGSIALGAAGFFELTPAAGPSGQASKAENGPYLEASIDLELGGAGVRWFVDLAASARKELVAKANGYAAGPWVLVEAGTGDPRVGPFPFDTYFHTDAAAVRTGPKLVLGEGRVRPWIGAAIGWWSWTVEYANADRTKRYGKDSGSAFGLSYMGGVELWVTEGFALDVFADVASPVAKIRIDDLFQPGWTWESTTGNHVMGPYRFALAGRAAF